MARKRRPTGDDATVARKRYYRAAQRYLNQSEQSTGATAQRYKQLARVELDNALKTYTKKTTQKFSAPIKKIASDLGVSLEEERQRIKSRSDEAENRIRSRAIDIGATTDEARRKKSVRQLTRSELALEGVKGDEETRRQIEARTILNSPIGSRIIGGLTDVWEEEAAVEDEYGNLSIDQKKILPALFDYFEVDNLADMLEKVEEIIGDKLYADEDSDAMYEAVKILLQTHVETHPNSYTE